MEHNTKPIKILMTIENTRRSGAQTFLMNVLRTIDKEKFKIDFAVVRDPDDGYHSEIIEYGCKIWKIPKFNGLNYRSYILGFDQILKDGKYDIVHGNISSTACIYLKCAKKYGCSTIVHSHSTGYRGTRLEVIAKRFLNLFIKQNADYLFACSNAAGRHLFGNRIENNPHFYKIPNGIIVENFRYNPDIRKKIRTELSISDDVLLLGHVGSFSEAKNHEFLLKVFQNVHKNTKSKLLLCGDGVLKNKIVDLAEQMKILEDIIFLGNVENVNDYYMAMDRFVFPSIFEGLGIVTIEAQTTGLPCFCSSGVPKEAKVTDQCFFLPLDDADVWAQQITKDYGERIDRSDAVRECGYDIKSTVQLLEDLYTRMSERNA